MDGRHGGLPYGTGGDSKRYRAGHRARRKTDRTNSDSSLDEFIHIDNNFVLKRIFLCFTNVYYIYGWQASA